MKSTHLGLIALTLLVGCRHSIESESSVATAQPTGAVTIKIDFDGEVTLLVIDDVVEGTMLEDVMRDLKEVPVSMRGSGATAFVESLGEKETSSGEGWTFLVDGEFAQQGVGTTALSPPTTITWKYGDFSEPQP